MAVVDGIEYRRYEPYLVAETHVVAGKRGTAANTGFRRLFDYISGANTTSARLKMTTPVRQSEAEPTGGQKIAMTTPVRQAPAEDGWTVAFVVPGEFTRETVPRPTDPNVYIREVPGTLVAVLGYSGRWTEKNVEKHKTRLGEMLRASGVVPVGAVVSAFYNAPFTLPFMRRNEALVEVAGLPADTAGL